MFGLVVDAGDLLSFQYLEGLSGYPGILINGLFFLRAGGTAAAIATAGRTVVLEVILRPHFFC